MQLAYFHLEAFLSIFIIFFLYVSPLPLPCSSSLCIAVVDFASFASSASPVLSWQPVLSALSCTSARTLLLLLDRLVIWLVIWLAGSIGWHSCECDLKMQAKVLHR